jgi:hypothetical protein
MTQAEGIIILLLCIIAYFLYQIAKQLSFLTGRKLRFHLPRLNMFENKHPKDHKPESPKLPN